MPLHGVVPSLDSCCHTPVSITLLRVRFSLCNVKRVQLKSVNFPFSLLFLYTLIFNSRFMSSLCGLLPAGGAASLAGHDRFRQLTRVPAICRVRYGYPPRTPGIVLPKPTQWRKRAAEKAGHGGAWERSSGSEEDSEKAGQLSYPVGELPAADDRKRVNRAVEVAVAAAVTVVMGVGNRVLYKLALVPLKQYPFFLAQLSTFGYVLVYFSILYIRYHAGIITDEMLSMPKTPFLVVGLLEALGAATGMAAGAMLPGASIPILSQTFLVWQILLSFIFLGRRYRVNQLLGCFLVAIGVIITVASGSSAGNSLKEAGIFWSLLMTVSFLFQAADTVQKEVIFLDATRKLKGGSVDLFVVNSFGSAFQTLFICLLLPFLSKLWGIPFSQLPNYLKDGAACFLNVGSLSSGCDGSPLLPLLYIIVNMGFNISLLYLLKISSAVVSCLASTFSVPISIYVFTLPLPYLSVASSLPTGFLTGAIILIMGLLIYVWTPLSGSSGASFPAST